MLVKKMLRDMKQNLSQFLAIFLMIFIGVFIYTGIGSEIKGMTESSKNFYKEANMPDLWAFGTFSSSQEIEKIADVKKATSKLVVNGNFVNKDNTDLEINFINSDKVSSLYVISGKKFSYDSDELWLDSKLAMHLNYKPGDTVTIKFNDFKITTKIAGLVMNPEHVYAIKDSSEVFPSHEDYGFVYLSSKAYPLGEKNIVYNYTLIDTDKPNKVKKAIDKAVPSVISVTNREANNSYSTFKTEIDGHETYAGIFPAIFLFIAVLSVITTMNRIVKNQRNEIGILKALGFKKSKITFHYTMYGAIICLFAIIAGHILGPLLLGNYILYLEEGYFELPSLITKVPFEYFIVSFAILLLIIVTSYLSCYRELGGSTAETLRPKTPKNFKHTWFEKQKLWHHLKFKTQWNLRDVFRSKLRSIMAIIGVAGSTMLIVCAFGMLNTLDNFVSWQYDDIYHFKNQVILNKGQDKKQIIASLDAGSVQTVGIEIIGDKSISSTITVDDSKGFVTYTNHDKKQISIPKDGIMMSEKLAERLNVKAGDKITFKIYGNDHLYTLKIKKLNRAPSTQNITMTRKYYESLGLVYNPDIIYTNKQVDDNVGIVSLENDLRENTSKMLSTMNSVILILILAALLLGSVVVYNLGILSYTEKVRELATLKVLGFNNKSVGKVLKQQNIWLTIIGILIGLPLGKKLVEYIFSSVMGYSFDIMPVVNISTYFIAFICIFASSIIVNAILNRKVKKLDMVTSLKAAD